MKKSLLFLVTLSISLASLAQNASWVWGHADPNTPITINPDFVHSCIAAWKDKALWCHAINKKFIGNELQGDYSVSLLDTAGNILTTAAITGKVAILSTHSDDQGNWYLLGKTEDTVSFASGPTYLKPADGSGYFICRLEKNNLMHSWFRFVGDDFFCSTACFTVKNNNVYYPVDSADATHLYKLDATTGAKTFLWAQQRRSMISSIQADSKSNIYLVGTCAFDGIDFNGHVVDLPVNFQYPQYIVRYRADGTHDWSYFMQDQTCFTRELALAGDNTLYYTGPLTDSLTIGQLHLDKPSVFGGYFAAKMDSSGNFYWGRQLSDGSSGSAIFADNAFAATDAQQELTIYLQTFNNIDWGNNIHTSNSHYGGTAVHFNLQGNTVWAKQVTARHVSPKQIAAGDRSIWVAGNAFDSTALHLDNVQVPLSATPFAYYPFVARLSTNATTNDVPIIPYRDLLTIVPNPATNQFSIAGMTNGEVTLQIVDQMGRSVMKGNITSNDKVNTANWARGMYFITITQKNDHTVRKLLLQ